MNPANNQDYIITEETRIPMGAPQMRLEVPDIPGFHLHWFADRPGRIPRAVRAGFQFVTPDEVTLNNRTLTDDTSVSGNTDLGNRVSIIEGG